MTDYTGEGFGTGKPYNHMTILRDGSGQYTGHLGERIFCDLLAANQITYLHCAGDKDQHDVVVRVGDRKVKIDVKTKRRNVSSSMDYDGHVTCDQKDYDSDIYVFVHVDDSGAEVMGWMKKADFWSECRTVEAGEKDGSFVERAGAGKIKYSAMRPINELIDGLSAA